MNIDNWNYIYEYMYIYTYENKSIEKIDNEYIKIYVYNY